MSVSIHTRSATRKELNCSDFNIANGNWWPFIDNILCNLAVLHEELQENMLYHAKHIIQETSDAIEAADNVGEDAETCLDIEGVSYSVREWKLARHKRFEVEQSQVWLRKLSDPEADNPVLVWQARKAFCWALKTCSSDDDNSIHYISNILLYLTNTDNEDICYVI